MRKECCKKVAKENVIIDICSECIKKLSDSIENVIDYDKEIWLDETIKEIPTEKDKFFCIYMKKLHDIMENVLKNKNATEIELTNLLNDIRYALHDIQAPVRAVTNFSEMILDLEYDDEQFEDYLNRIYSASIRITDMLNDIRDIMILGKKKSEVIKKINFEQIINDVKDNLNDIINDRNAIISINLDHAPSFRSNMLRWTRVFQNLILNAILYNKNIPNIYIWFDSEKIYIKDNGIGIPVDKKEAVFELFTRLSDRQEMADGTGAGLFMCRKFLSMDGFCIDIFNTDDSGTTFVIYRS